MHRRKTNSHSAEMTSSYPHFSPYVPKQEKKKVIQKLF